MNLPPRCFSCNKIIGDIWEEFDKMKAKQISFKDICKELDIKRYCCKRMFLTHDSFYDKFSQYNDQNIRLVTIQHISKLSRLFHTT